MTESGFRPTGTPDLAVAKSHNDFAMLEPREQLATLLKEHVVGRPFSELAAVTFDHRAATVMGHVLIDAWLSEKSYVQTSSLVTLRNGNELSLDFGIVEQLGAKVVAIASLVGGGAKDINVVNPSTGDEQPLPFIQVFDESELR